MGYGTSHWPGNVVLNRLLTTSNCKAFARLLATLLSWITVGAYPKASGTIGPGTTAGNAGGPGSIGTPGSLMRNWFGRMPSTIDGPHPDRKRLTH